MSESIKKGKLIVIEGADGSGTTTQARMLFETLNKNFPWTNAVLTSEPSANPVGIFIRELLKSKEECLTPREMMLLFYADRDEHYRSVITPAIDNGFWVVCDRNWHSTLVYQALISDNVTQMVNLVQVLNKACSIPKIDHCFILDVPWKQTKKRMINRKEVAEVYETEEIQKKVIEAYRLVPEHDPTAILLECSDKNIKEVNDLIFNKLVF